MNTITFSQSIEGYLLAANARRLSPNTINDYSFTFHKFKPYLGHYPPIAEISVKDIQIFLSNQNNISKKAILNYHTGLSAMWTWCLDEELVNKHILHKVKRPKPEIRDIRPYTQAEVQAMLSVLKTSKTYTRPGKRECSHKLPLADRNKAIIYLWLDTGIRASELGNLRIHHVDVRNRRITIMGKGSKQWHKFNRYVKKGEKGIPILAPLMFRVDPDDPDNKKTELYGFMVVYEFDISQTDGEPLPEPPEWKSP